MSDDDDDDEKLPARKGKPPSVPARSDGQPMVPKVGGVVDAAMTGWRARSAAKSYRDIRDALDATKGAVSSGIGLKRELDRLADLDNILDEDQKQRDHERWLAEQAREADRVQAEPESEIRKWETKARLERAMNEAIHEERLRQGTEAIKDLLVEDTMHRIVARVLNNEGERLAAELGISSLRNRAAGNPANTVASEYLNKILDDEIKAAVEAREPSEVIIRLGNLKRHVEYADRLLAAIDEEIRKASEANEPYQVPVRLTNLKGRIDDSFQGPK